MRFFTKGKKILVVAAISMAITAMLYILHRGKGSFSRNIKNVNNGSGIASIYSKSLRVQIADGARGLWRKIANFKTLDDKEQQEVLEEFMRLSPAERDEMLYAIFTNPSEDSITFALNYIIAVQSISDLKHILYLFDRGFLPILYGLSLKERESLYTIFKYAYDALESNEIEGSILKKRVLLLAFARLGTYSSVKWLYQVYKTGQGEIKDLAFDTLMKLPYDADITFLKEQLKSIENFEDGKDVIRIMSELGSPEAAKAVVKWLDTAMTAGAYKDNLNEIYDLLRKLARGYRSREVLETYLKKIKSSDLKQILEEVLRKSHNKE